MALRPTLAAAMLLLSAALAGCPGKVPVTFDGGGGDPPPVQPRDAGIDAAIACADDCAARGQVCVPGMGCLACVPRSETCSLTNGTATYCRSDGSGLVLSTCDEAQGLSCSDGRCVGACAAANLESSYLGCEFWPTTLINDVNNSFDFEVAVANSSTTDRAIVKVTGGALAAPMELEVAPGAVARIPLPWVPEVKVCNESSLGNGFDQVNACSPAHNPDYSSRIVRGGAYRLTSDVPVAAYQFAPIQSSKNGVQAGTTEASLLLPTTVLGSSYRIATYGQGFARGSLAVVATVDGTTVILAPTVDPTAGTTTPLVLNRGDVLEVMAGTTSGASNVGDLTGTLVEADKPIEVFGAHGCAWVIDSRSCDHLEETMLPLGSLGREYVVKAPTYPLSAAYVARIVAVEDDTHLAFDPADVHAPAIMAHAGDVLDLAAHDLSFGVTSDRRILVAGLNEGDNTLAVYVPTQLYRRDYLFLTPEFQHTSIRFLAKLGASVTLDDAPVFLWTGIGTTGYAWATVEVAPGAHRATSTQPFGIMIFGNQEAGYVPGGLPSAFEMAGGLDVHDVPID